MGVKSIVVNVKSGFHYGCPFEIGEIVHVSLAPKEDRKIINYIFGADINKIVQVDEYPLSPDGQPWYWSSDCFAPVSDIDETEMKREYNLNKVVNIT